MVGIGTLLSDDPRLNTRLPDRVGCDPLRVVVDSQLQMPVDSAMLQQKSTAKTLIATVVNKPRKSAALQQAGAEVLQLPASDGQVSLAALWQELGRRNVQRLLLEGGATLAGAALRAGLIDQLMVFIAPKLIGGATEFGIFSGKGCQQLADAVRLTDMRHEQVAEDILLTGDVVRCLPD
jgi:diaminohydroxyphosphoribosylaminopyrimidine deaminase/5-amino-6-(5-phosphoribosylamino)uracil reductase